MRAAVKSPYEGLEPRAFWRTGVAESESYPPDDKKIREREHACQQPSKDPMADALFRLW
jgi:hypothetical protein